LAVIENSALVALRTTFGGYTLQQALEHRAEISQQVCTLMTPHMNKIGVKVEEAQVLLSPLDSTWITLTGIAQLQL
jgi:regulator of protease activity HflC (stomatin/prohibitin superfamily)